jgi:CheY-like chemotaxis protein
LQALIGVRKRSADKTYAVSMMYWGSCDAVLGIVDRISAMNGRLLALDGDSGGNGGALGVVLSSIALSAPGPVELCMEINRLMFMKQSVGPSLPMTTLNLPAVAGLTPAMADAAAAAVAIGGATSAGDAMAWTGSVAALNNLIIHSSKGNALSELLNADSIRLYYLLYGLQRALRAGILECRDHRSNLALREQWMNAIADALLYVLDQDWRSSPYGMNHEDFRSRSGAGDTSRMNSARLSSRNDTTRSSDSASRGGALGSARSGGPLSARAAGARGAETGSRSTHGAGGAVRYNMLVVDDSHMNRKMILKALLKEGHVCEEAEDGLQAIAKVLEKQTTPSTLYDGILMDFVMPNMDGPTATKALRAMGYNGVILGVTGNQLSFDIEHFVECGANKVLMKPLKMDEFRQSMELGNVNTTSGQSTRAQKKKRASVSKGQNAAVLGEDEAVEQAAVSYEVLIVDDSGTNRKMLRRMMTSAGHQCDEAEDGLQAIMKAKQKIEQSGLSKRSYDVVLMDYVMPNMDGPTTTKALRAMGYEGVVIGITGNNVDFDHFMNCGANRVIEKPLKIEMFVDVMDTFDKKQRQEKAKRAGIAEDDGSGPGSMVATSRCGRRRRGLSGRHVAFTCT